MTTTDKIFGNKDDIIALIIQERWELASRYGDQISFNAVEKNQDWWWEQCNALTHVDKQQWNSCSYGNIAIGVHYGSRFPERLPIINKIKSILLRDL
jgi:hypothetical protein